MTSPRKPIGAGMRPPLERGNDLARAQTLAHSGRIDDAIATTDRHVGQGSRHAEFLRLRASLEQVAGRHGLAAAFAARAEAIESHPDSLLILARADVRAGETDRGIERARAVLRMVPRGSSSRRSKAQRGSPRRRPRSTASSRPAPRLPRKRICTSRCCAPR